MAEASSKKGKLTLQQNRQTGKKYRIKSVTTQPTKRAMQAVRENLARRQRNR